MPDVPAALRNLPVMPVAMALVVGFSLGLAVSIALDARNPKTQAAVPPARPCGCTETAAAPGPITVNVADAPDT